MASAIPQNTVSFTFSELIAATGGIAMGATKGEVRGVFTDTREAAAGKVFVALRGERFDGHSYLGTALAGGAMAVIVEDEVQARRVLVKRDDVLALVVPDTLRALGDLAAFHRRRFALPVVAICGAAGKTTTRAVLGRLLRGLLGERLHATKGNLNNRIGVPMTIFGLESKHELMLLELGTNEPGEVRELGRIASPTCAILTLIALEHTEGLGDLDGVEREEGSIFAEMSGNSRIAIGNGEDARVRRQVGLASVERKIFYGYSNGELVELVSRRLLSPEESELELKVGGRAYSTRTSLQGAAGVLAALASLTAVEALFPASLTPEVLNEALRGPFEAGRAQLVRLRNGALLLDDTYNSNPASLKESVRTGSELAQMAGGRLFVVAGEMRELGELSPSAHHEAGLEIAALAPHRVFGLVGDAQLLTRAAADAGAVSEFFDEVAAVAPRVLETLAENDVVVIKASRGVAAEGVVAGLVQAVGLLETSATHGSAQTNPGAAKTKI